MSKGKRRIVVVLAAVLCMEALLLGVRADIGTDEGFEAVPFEVIELQEEEIPAGQEEYVEVPPVEESYQLPQEEEEKEEILHQPKLVMETHNLPGQGLAAGEQIQLTVSFRNRSRDRSIYNLKLSVLCEEAGITLGKNSFYFEGIGPQGQAEVDTFLSVSPQAEQKNVAMEFTMEYEDDKGTACTGSEKLGFYVFQPAEAHVSGFHMGDQVYASDRLQRDIVVVNTGRSPIYDVQVTVEGPGLFTVNEVLLGNLEAGASGEGKLGLYIGTKDMKEPGEGTEGADKEKYGSVQGRLVLTYEDAKGEQHKQEEEFTTVIQKAKIMELRMEEEEKATNQWWISIFVLVLAAALGGIVVLGIRLKISHRRLEDAMVVQKEYHAKE